MSNKNLKGFISATLTASILACSSAAIAGGFTPNSTMRHHHVSGGVFDLMVYAKSRVDAKRPAPAECAYLSHIALHGEVSAEPRKVTIGFIDTSHPDWPELEVFAAPKIYKTIMLLPGYYNILLSTASLVAVDMKGCFSEVISGGFQPSDTFDAVLDPELGLLEPAVQ